MTVLEPAIQRNVRSRGAALAGAALVHALLVAAGLFALRHPALHDQVFGDSVAVTLVASAPGGGAMAARSAASQMSQMLQQREADIPAGLTEPARAAAPATGLSEILDGSGAAGGGAKGQDIGSGSDGAFGFDDPYAHVSLYRDKAAAPGQVVRNQVARCWRAQPGLPGVILHVQLEASGALRGDPKAVGAATDPASAEAVARARQALKACAPYPIVTRDPQTLSFDLKF